MCVSDLLFSSSSSQAAPQSVQRPDCCAGWLCAQNPLSLFQLRSISSTFGFLMITFDPSDIWLQDYDKKGRKNQKFLLVRPKRDESQPTFYTVSFHLGLQKFLVCILSRSLMGRIDVMFVAVPNIRHSKVKGVILTTEKSRIWGPQRDLLGSVDDDGPRTIDGWPWLALAGLRLYVLVY